MKSLKRNALTKHEIKKTLGVALSTGNNRLIKKILFYYVSRHSKECYRCGEDLTENDWTFEHKIPWMYSDDPLKNFFDFENIAFSHKNCNYGDSRKALKKNCPSISNYREGCRCEGCISIYKRMVINENPDKKLLKKNVKSHERREGISQLGMDVSTAYNRLSRNILIDFLEKEGYACSKCGGKITRDNYLITHKKNWMQQPFPKSYFYSLNNVTFIHKKCNHKGSDDGKKKN